VDFEAAMRLSDRQQAPSVEEMLLKQQLEPAFAGQLPRKGTAAVHRYGPDAANTREERPRPTWAAFAFARLSNGVQTVAWASDAELEAVVSYIQACTSFGHGLLIRCRTEQLRRKEAAA